MHALPTLHVSGFFAGAGWFGYIILVYCVVIVLYNYWDIQRRNYGEAALLSAMVHMPRISTCNIKYLYKYTELEKRLPCSSLLIFLPPRGSQPLSFILLVAHNVHRLELPFTQLQEHNTIPVNKLCRPF